eukprot:g17744.t1
MVIIGHVEHHSAGLLKYKLGDRWRMELRRQFEADYLKAMAYVMNRGEGVKDMDFLPCSVGLQQPARTAKLCARKMGRLKKEGHKCRTGLKPTAGAGAAVSRKDWQDARARRGGVRARCCPAQCGRRRGVSPRAEQVRANGRRGGKKKKPPGDRVEPPPPKDEKKEKARPLVLVENGRQFYEAAEKETAERYCEGRGGDYRATLPNRCNRVAQPIANEKPPAITLKKVQGPASAVLLGRWCRAQRKRTKTLRAAAVLAAGMSTAEAGALLAEDGQGYHDGQEVGEDEPEPEEEARPLKEYLEKVKDPGPMLSPVLITTLKHKNSEKGGLAYIADVMPNPARFKGMALHRTRSEEAQKEWGALGDRADLCAKKAPPQPEPAKEVATNENSSALRSGSAIPLSTQMRRGYHQ